MSFPEENEVKVFNEKGREKTWEFDEVFNTESSQEQVYREVSDLVTSVLDGYNICIFAYVMCDRIVTAKLIVVTFCCLTDTAKLGVGMCPSSDMNAGHFILCN